MVCPHPCTCGKNEFCTGQGGYIIIIMNACTFVMYFQHLSIMATT